MQRLMLVEDSAYHTLIEFSESLFERNLCDKRKLKKDEVTQISEKIPEKFRVSSPETDDLESGGGR
jgi:hypothetical protein